MANTIFTGGNPNYKYVMNAKNTILFTTLPLLLALFGCNTKENEKPYDAEEIQSQMIIEMINAVNERNAEKYVAQFAENV